MTGIVTSPVIGLDLTAVVTGTGTSFDQGNQFKLGTVVTAQDGQQWMYVHASAAITRYRFVGIDEDFEAASLTAAMVVAGWQIGLAEAVGAADNDFLWVSIKGANLTGSVGAGTVADIQLYTSATAGVLSDLALTSVGVSVATMVYGVVVVTAGITSAGANVEVMIGTYPYAASATY